MIAFDFDEVKTAQASAYLLKLNGGAMNAMKLIKLLYLCDREALRRWDRPITGDAYYSLEHGPIVSKTYNIIKGERESEAWEALISQRENYSVHLLRDGDLQELSRRELALLEEKFREFKDSSHWQLRDYCHENIPEWRDPGKSRIPITVEEILLNLGKSTSEIKAIEEEVSSLKAIKHRLLA
jgi:uncharacterized phage-associated protein